MITFTESQIMGWLGQFLWPFVRALSMLAVAPVLGHDSIPSRLKVALAAALAFALAPILPANMPSPSTAAALPALVQQIAVGTMLGLAARLAFAAIEMAGDLIGLQMGLSFATFIDPQNSTPSPLIGSFLGVVAMLTFLSFDGHLALVAALAESFRSVPPGASIAQFADAKVFVRWGSELFRLGLHISLPVVAAMLAANMALAILVRAAPQLNIFSVGFPATLLIGLAVLMASLPALMPLIEAALRSGLLVGVSR
ncbi:flagellar biosynthetic protein FliR [Betaproteobacteria bacterium GR16-43]|nr:flagellar biosynthetic protein FliR [Betaproteobacteria bacterium GR16-43]